MIIFSLDGTLADCEHRRHFVDRDKAAEMDICYEEVEYNFGGVQNGPWVLTKDPERLWKPDWHSFYDACDKDLPIEPVIDVLSEYLICDRDIVIWSGRCESVREKTEAWIQRYIFKFLYEGDCSDVILKMRPIGDNTPDDQLKEHWYDLHNVEHPNQNIEMVFDSDPDSIAMWRRRGIFVFDCNQTGKEF